MTKTYIAARRAFRAGRFPNLRITEYAGNFCIENADDNYRILDSGFISAEAARIHRTKECDRASKWIV